MHSDNGEMYLQIILSTFNATPPNGEWKQLPLNEFKAFLFGHSPIGDVCWDSYNFSLPLKIIAKH